MKQISPNQFSQKMKFLDHLETQQHPKFHEDRMTGYQENRQKHQLFAIFGDFLHNQLSFLHEILYAGVPPDYLKTSFSD